MMENNGVFIQKQEDLTEEINLRIFVKPKHEIIKREMQEFLRELK